MYSFSSLLVYVLFFANTFVQFYEGAPLLRGNILTCYFFLFILKLRIVSNKMYFI